MSEEQAKSLTTVTQALTGSEFTDSRKELLKFVKSTLKETKTGEGGDYGVIPYTKKKSLLKPGAEKLAKLFGLSISYEKLAEVEDWEKGFVYYRYKCTLTHFVTGRFVGDAIRSCNNKEKKHASKGVYEVANTIEAVAQKRALVAAVVAATNASDIFDADTPSEFEEEAPNRKVTAEEDPRRTRLYSRLYGSATERGFGDKALHNAAKRLYSINESLNELSNEQIEDFTLKLISTYKVVGKGKAPQKVTDDVVETKPEVEEGEVIEAKPIEYWCKGKKHDSDVPETMVKTTIDNPWCSDECKESYFGTMKVNKRMDDFIKNRGFKD